MMKEQNESGFSLIELLTAMTIIGLLASVAFSQMKQYQTRSFDARAEHDLRVLITAQEAYFVDNEEYLACENAACEEELPSFSLSPGTELQVELILEGQHFEVSSTHPTGQRAFSFNSETRVYLSELK